jgi:hypothetical protein
MHTVTLVKPFLCMLALSSYSTPGLEPISPRNVFNGSATPSNPTRRLAIHCCFSLRTIGAYSRILAFSASHFDSVFLDYRLWLTLDRASIQPHVVSSNYLPTSLQLWSDSGSVYASSCVLLTLTMMPNQKKSSIASFSAKRLDLGVEVIAMIVSLSRITPKIVQTHGSRMDI